MRTLQGAAIVGLLVISVPSVYGLVRDGPFAPGTVAPSVVLGSLVLAHLAFSISYVAMVAVSIATGTVLQFQHAPLRAHGALLPLAFTHEIVVSGILRSAIPVLALFYGLHWRLLVAQFTSPAAWVVHVLLMAMGFVALGAITFVWLRRTLRTSDVHARAMAVNKRGALCALLATFGALAGERLLAQRAPGVLSAVGVAASHGLVFLIPPMQAATTLATTVVPAVVWLLIGSATTVLLWRALLRAASGFVADFPTDCVAFAPASVPPKLQSLTVGRGLVRRASLFGAKDLLLPVLRAPARHFSRQWLAFASVAGLLLMMRFAVADATTTVAPVLFPLLAALYAVIQSPLATLHLLGVEGRHAALLRTMLPARTLMLLKGAPAMLFVAVHTLIGVLLLLMLGAALGFARIPVIETIAVAIIGAALGAALGAAMGFLFPDFERRSVGNPGASLVGRVVFTMTAGFALSVFGMLRLILGTGAITRGTFSVTIGILSVVLAVVIVGLGHWGTRRLSRVEI